MKKAFSMTLVYWILGLLTVALVLLYLISPLGESMTHVLSTFSGGLR